MDATGLLEPILTGGIKNTNFFNGRIVTAEDLRTEQAAKKRQLAQVAAAVGDGVVWGFDVTLAAGGLSDPPALRVTPGLALNRNGEAVALAVETRIRFGPPASTPSADAGLFRQCEPPSLQFENFGMHILTVKPASGLQGRAPMTELGMEGVGTTCGSRYAVEGVKFGTVPLTVPTGAGASPLASETAKLVSDLETQLAVLERFGAGAAASITSEVTKRLSRVRSAVAYLCFGVERFTELAADPLPRTDHTTPFAEYGLLDALRKGEWLSDCEVPLALLYWSTRGVEFIDWWSVRRPVFPAPASPPWAPVSGERWPVEGLVMTLQFQQHITDLLSAGPAAPLALRSVDYFRYLPPVGLLPIVGLTPAAGFDSDRFFGTRTVLSPSILEGARLSRLWRTALHYPPIDLRLAPSQLIWRHLVRENLQAASVGGTGARPVLVFVNGQVPFAAQAQYDLSHWSFANYV